MKFRISFIIATTMLLGGATNAQKADTPSLKDTLSWMHNFADANAFQYVFQDPDNNSPCAIGARGCQLRHDVSTFNSQGCSATVTLTLTLDLKEIGGTTYVFSLKDLDPNRVTSVSETPLQNAVRAETTNKVKTITESLSLAVGNATGPVEPDKDTWLEIVFDSKDDANRFANAFKHAIQLCGGKPSLF